MMPNAIALYVSRGGNILWNVQFPGDKYDSVQQIKFNKDQKKVVMALKPFAIAVYTMQPSYAFNVYTEQELSPSSMQPGGFYINPQDMLYVGLQTSNFKWQVLSLDITKTGTTTILSPKNYLRYSGSSIGAAFSIQQNTPMNRLYVGGFLKSSVNGKIYSTIEKINTDKNIVVNQWGFEQHAASKFLVVTSLKYLKVSSVYDYLFACHEQNVVDSLTGQIPLIISRYFNVIGDSPPTEHLDYALPNLNSAASSNIYKCTQTYVVNQNKLLLLIQDVNMGEAYFAQLDITGAAVGTFSFYKINAIASGTSQMYAGYLSSTKAFYAGGAKDIILSPTFSSTKTFAYVMSLDLSADTCFTTATTPSFTVWSVAFGSRSYLPFSDSISVISQALSQPTVSISNMVSTSVLNNAAACPLTTAVISSSLASQTHTVFNSNTYTFSQFTINLACLDTAFTYQILNMPSFTTYNANLRRFTFNSVNPYEAGTYTIQVVGTLTNTQTLTASFTLTVVNPCATATVTNAVGLSNINYVVTDPYFTFSFPAYTSSNPNCQVNFDLGFQLPTLVYTTTMPTFVQEILSLNKAIIYTSTTADIGSYTFTLCHILIGWATSVCQIFTVNILHPCEKQLISYNVISDYYIMSGNTNVPFDTVKLNWRIPLPACTDPITYSYTISPSMTSATLSLTPLNVIQVTSLAPQTASYLVTITGQILGYPGSQQTQSYTIYFDSTLTGCQLSRAQIGPVLSSYVYLIGETPLAITFDPWIDSAFSTCVTQDLYKETLSYSPSIGSITHTFSSPAYLQTFSSSNLADDGTVATSTIKGQLYIASGALGWKTAPSYQVIFASPCQPPYTTYFYTLGVATAIPSSTVYYVTQPTLSIPTPTLDFTPSYAICGSVKYEMLNADNTVLNTAVFTFVEASQVLMIQTDLSTLAKTYDLVFNVYQSSSSVKYPMYFTVDVKKSCAQNKITPPPAQTINVRIGYKSIVDLKTFTAAVTMASDGTLCNSYLYACSRVSGTRACDSSIYTLSNAQQSLEIFTSDVTLIGTQHVLKIYGNQAGVTDLTGMQLTISFSSDVCNNAYIISYPVLSYTYDLSFVDSRIVSQFQWDKSDPQCPNITYSFLDLSVSSNILDASVFTFNQANNTLSVYTSDPSKVKTYQIRVIGSMSIFKDQIDFQVVVTNVCPTTKITTPIIKPLTFDISQQDPLIVNFKAFTISQLICGQISYALTKKDGSRPQSFIQLNADLFQLEVQTKSPLSVGTYQYYLAGSLPGGAKANVLIQLSVTFRCSSSQLTVSAGAQIPDDIYQIGSGIKSIELPPSLFSSTVLGCGDITQQVFILDRKPLPPYLKYSDGEIQVQTNEEALDGVTITIQIIGTLPANKATNQVKFALTLVKLSDVDKLLAEEEDAIERTDPQNNTAQNVKKKHSQMKPTLNATITEIDFNQKVTIKFTKNMLIPRSIGVISKAKAIQFTVLEGGGSGRTLDIVKGWNITSFKNDTLVVVLFFDDPSTLSMSRVYDKLRVQFKINSLFVSANQDEIIPQNYVITKSIPPQLKNTTATRALQSMTTVAGQTLTSTVSLNIVLSLFLGVSLKKVWMLMNTLQILVNMPLLNIPMPSNVLYLFQALIDLSNFNFIPKEQIKGYFKSMGLIPESTGSATNKTEEVSGNFQTMDIF